jgi:hypothetical protein
MFKPEFSEFTFGYAFTSNFTEKWIGGGVKTVPIFPSLSEEGKLGVGYDVAIPTHAEPILFQFKIPQIVKRRSRNLPKNFSTPYYRMHLEPGAKSTQHQSLLEHSIAGRQVYYVSTRFDLLDQLNRGFRAGSVPSDCIYFKPEAIGPLDGRAHFVAYEQKAQSAWLFSEPVEIEPPTHPDLFQSDVRTLARNAPAVGPRGEYFARLSDELIRSVRRAAEREGPLETPQTAPETTDVRFAAPRDPDLYLPRDPNLYVYEELRRLPTRDLLTLAEETREIEEPITRFAALATFVLDCHVVLVGRNEE